MQAAALESVLLEGAKCILGCSSMTCNEAVRETSDRIHYRVIGK